MLTQLENIPNDYEFGYYGGQFNQDTSSVLQMSVQNSSPSGSLAIESLLVVPIDYDLSNLPNNEVGSPLLWFEPTGIKNIYKISSICASAQTCN